MPNDRRTFIAALICAALAPQWQHRLQKETQHEAAHRLAQCAVLIADELLAILEPASWPVGVAVTNQHLKDLP